MKLAYTDSLLRSLIFSQTDDHHQSRLIHNLLIAMPTSSLDIAGLKLRQKQQNQMDFLQESGIYLTVPILTLNFYKGYLVRIVKTDADPLLTS